MAKWTAQLLQSYETVVRFSEYNPSNGQELEGSGYDIKDTVKAGVRRFSTKKDALKWVEAVNKKYSGYAVFIGKTA